MASFNNAVVSWKIERKKNSNTQTKKEKADIF